MNLLSISGAAKTLGMSRDALQFAFRIGAPEPAQRVAGRRVFTPHDLDAIQRWLNDRARTGRTIGQKAN